uniref:Uncharacterized protein n=1 Tax=Eptatretus burgeri TaxID=7764 RepID=A0A8C4WX75_EPTBU
MRIIERFVILLYDRTSKCTDIDKARRKLFARKNNVQLIPPTKAALEEHVKRAVYQGGHVWGQILLPAPELPPPTNWGLREREKIYLWTAPPPDDDWQRTADRGRMICRATAQELLQHAFLQLAGPPACIFFVLCLEHRHHPN